MDTGKTMALELKILSDKLANAERKLEVAEDVIKRQAGAIIDVDYKIYHSMKQLLTANDVYKTAVGHDPMRVNVLEIMNDLRRFARAQFEKAGIMAYAEEPDGSIDRSATPVTNKVQLAGTGDADWLLAGNSVNRGSAS